MGITCPHSPLRQQAQGAWGLILGSWALCESADTRGHSLPLATFQVLLYA